jgi:hypothetical protein
MSRSSTTIWKQALSSWDLPACPPDLNEPQYVRLAFDHHCHVRHLLSVFYAPSMKTIADSFAVHLVFKLYYGLSEQEHARNA